MLLDYRGLLDISAARNQRGNVKLIKKLVK